MAGVAHSDCLLINEFVMQQFIVDGEIVQIYQYDFSTNTCLVAQRDRSTKKHIRYLSTKIEQGCMLMPTGLVEAAISAYTWTYIHH